jgi:hypothetical protein
VDAPPVGHIGMSAHVLLSVETGYQCCVGRRVRVSRRDPVSGELISIVFLMEHLLNLCSQKFSCFTFI